MKCPTELYACVYIREFPAQALLRLQPELKESPCVVLEGEPPFEKVCSLNTKARLLGIRLGMSRTDIDGFSQAQSLLRSYKTELTVKEMVLECAGTYSPRVEDCSGDTYFLCVIDIAGTEYLFGAANVLAQRVLQQVHSFHLSARVTVSTNFHAAVCLAKGSGRTIDIVRSGDTAGRLSSLPLKVLSLTDEQAEIFSLWGITTLGMLAALPEEELIARIGQEGKRLQQLARGELPHLFQPRIPPFRLEERQELDFPLDSLDSLMFGVAVMLDQLILRASTCLVALATVTIILEMNDGKAYMRRVRPARPGNDKQFWIRLLHLELQAHPPQAAVVAATLAAEPGDTSTVQLGLFSPPLPEAARLDVTLAQLKVLLGEDNVGHPALLDSHATDGFRLMPFSVPSDSSSFNIAQQRAAARQLRPPETISVYQDRSRPGSFFFCGHFFAVEHAYGPWIAGGEWWNAMSWNTEQWDVIGRALNGAVICCCMVRDFLQHQWQVTTIYD